MGFMQKLTCEPTEFVGDNGDGVFPFGTSEKPLFEKYSDIVFWASFTSCLRILYNFKYVNDWHLKLKIRGKSLIRIK